MIYLKIPTPNTLLRVRLRDIVYIKADGNYSELFFSSGWKHVITLQLHVLAETFAQCGVDDFIRVGKSIIVNQKYVSMINLTDKKLVLQSGEMADVFIIESSRDALKELKEKMVGGQYGE